MFWISDPDNPTVILRSAAVTMGHTRFRAPPARSLLIADACACGLFTLTGSEVTEWAGRSGLLLS